MRFIGPLEPLDVRWSRAHARTDRCQWAWRELFFKEPPKEVRGRDPFPEERRNPIPGRAVPLSLVTMSNSGGGVTGGWTLCGRHTFWVRSAREAQEVEEVLHCDWHLWQNEPAEAMHSNELPPTIERGEFTVANLGYHYPCPLVTCGVCLVNRDKVLENAEVTVELRGPEALLKFLNEPHEGCWDRGIYRRF